MRVNIMSVQMVKEKTLQYGVGPKQSISSPDEAAQLVQAYLGNPDRENLVVVCVNSKNMPIAINTVSIGSLNSSVVHPREVFKIAILANAAGIIVAHNHPSGDTTPSKEDRSITETLNQAGQILGIAVLDHVIVGNDENDAYYSFKEHGNI